MLPLLAQTLAAPTPVAVRVASLKAVAALVPHVQVLSTKITTRFNWDVTD
jgi:hypothetical protein